MEIRVGQKIRTVYGKIETVCYISIDGFIKTLGRPNDYIHPSKYSIITKSADQ